MKIKKILKDIILTCFSWFVPGNSVVVLMYHSVSRSGWEFSVEPEVFEKQIGYLHKKGYKFLTSQELEEIISGKNNQIKKGVLVTFDDGYKDFLSEAMPILKKYQVPAIIFAHTNRSSERLKNNLPLLSWDDLKFLAKDYEVASHSHSHPNIKDLSVAELERDIAESDHILSDNLSKPTSFAYPFGRFTQQAVDILKRSGYRLGFTIDRGMVKIGSDPFRIKRFGIAENTSFTEFKARITSASDWYEKLLRISRLQ